jgi:CBS domain containing-hemolysin-like protein
VFVTAEFGLVAADRGRLGRRADDGARSARVARRLLGDLPFHLSAAQFGITVTSLLLGFLIEPAVGDLLESLFDRELPRGLSVVVALALAASVQIVVGELVPKAIALSHPERSLRAVAFPVWLYGVIAGPIIRLFARAGNRIVRVFGVERVGTVDARSLEEMREEMRGEMIELIRSSGEVGTLHPADVTLLERSIRFGEKTAADVLVPRVEVDAIGHDETVADLIALALESGHSRFPVTVEDLDHVIGVVHVKAVYGLAPAQRATTRVDAIMSEVLAVPEARDLDALFADFRSSGTYLAVVVDEHGGTAGIITLEDLLEELVGEIADEYDEAPSTRTKIDQGGSFVLPGRLHHDEVLDACGFDMPEGDYETLAGFVLDRLGHIPQPGERFRHDGWQIEVVAVERLRVATVRLRSPRRDPDGGATR